MKGSELPVNTMVILIIILIVAVISALIIMMVYGASNPLLDTLRAMIGGGVKT